MINGIFQQSIYRWSKSPVFYQNWNSLQKRSQGKHIKIQSYEIGHKRYAQFPYILTHEYKICCLIISDFVCLSLESGLFSCSSLLPNLSLKISFVCVSCLILLLNSKSFSVNLKTVHKHYFSSKPSQKTVDKGGPYNIIVCSVNIGHLMLALYLIITWSNDIYYGNMFFLESDQWKNSKLCALNFFFITSYILLIPHCVFLLF